MVNSYNAITSNSILSTSATTTINLPSIYFDSPKAVCKKHGVVDKLSLSDNKKQYSFCFTCLGEYLAEMYPVVTDDEPLTFEAAKAAWGLDKPTHSCNCSYCTCNQRGYYDTDEPGIPV